MEDKRAGKSIGTGIRMTPAHMQKLDSMARQLAVSRNQMIALLIEGAEVESCPRVAVNFDKVERAAA